MAVIMVDTDVYSYITGSDPGLLSSFSGRKLANTRFIRDHPQMERAEIDHLQRDLSIESSMDRRCRQMNDDSDASQRATALYASGKTEVPVEVDALTRDSQHVPGMFAERRKDHGPVVLLFQRNQKRLGRLSERLLRQIQLGFEPGELQLLGVPDMEFLSEKKVDRRRCVLRLQWGGRNLKGTLRERPFESVVAQNHLSGESQI